MESGHSSPRADKFPAGLRVLVVDDDPTWLKILEKMLKKCSYEVTTCCLAKDALSLLRERKDGFDLVISDVNMPDMDGFKLLEHVGLELDLPVIMMSVDGETSRVMKGVQHGACDYLLKPIRMKELSNIWQHVLRKKIHEGKDTDHYEYLGKFQLINNKSEEFHDAYGGSFGISKKRKEVYNVKHDDQLTFEPSSTKKSRVVWTVDLHKKFVGAVNQIGFDKVGPKKILDAIKVPGLTRENVASHLQKFRLYLSRLQKENELKASSKGTNSFGTNQINTVQENHGIVKNKTHEDQEIHEFELKGMVSFSQSRKVNNPSKIESTRPPLQQWKDVPKKQPSNQFSSPVPLHHFADVDFPYENMLNRPIVDQHFIDNRTHDQRKMSEEEEVSTFVPSLEENIQFLLQEYGSREHIGYQNCFYGSDPIDELQIDPYGELAIHWNKPLDVFEGTFVDQSSFIA